MGITTRKRILLTIQKHQLITVSEIGFLLDLDPANIRHHLAILKDECLIEESNFRKQDGKGRPKNVYSISKVFKEDGLDQLTGEIFRMWRSAQSDAAFKQTISVLARHLSGKAGEFPHFYNPKQLTACMEHLNRLHYQAQWEASPSGPRIKLRNCPYWRLINQVPELCRMDKELIELLTGLKMEQTSKLERDERGLLVCSFIGD